jgi:hypothetical protein
MEQALLAESNTRFRQAADTPAMTSLFPHLGRDGMSEGAEQILAGTFQPPDTIIIGQSNGLTKWHVPVLHAYALGSLGRGFRDRMG